MPVGKIISTKVEKNRDGDKKVLMMQVEITDPDDIQDVELMKMAGDDSNPSPGSMCFIVQSGESWKIAIAVDDGIESTVGYGEKKIYSSKDGVIVASAYFKEDGIIAIDFDTEVIFNAGNDFAVRFNELETAFNQLKQDHNDLLAHYVDHIHTNPAGNTSIPLLPPPFPLPSTADIAPAKIDEIKVP